MIPAAPPPADVSPAPPPSGFDPPAPAAPPPPKPALLGLRADASSAFPQLATTFNANNASAHAPIALSIRKRSPFADSNVPLVDCMGGPSFTFRAWTRE
jgi:hypothetical protein